jgi:hypothetical protein
MDGRRYESGEGGVRVKHDCMAMIVPTILLHFLHPWRSDVGGRATHGAVAEEARTEFSRPRLHVSPVHYNQH